MNAVTLDDWVQLSGSVWLHRPTGRRLHMLGTLRLENGEYLEAYRWPGSLITNMCIRQVGDKQRGLFLWAMTV